MAGGLRNIMRNMLDVSRYQNKSTRRQTSNLRNEQVAKIFSKLCIDYLQAANGNIKNEIKSLKNNINILADRIRNSKDQTFIANAKAKLIQMQKRLKDLGG